MVDSPPGLDFAGPASGEFRARGRPRRLARFTFAMCLLDSLLTFWMAARNIYAPGTTMLLVGPMMCLCIAGVGLAVRSAHIRVDTGGIEWGWAAMSFRMARDRIAAIRFHPTAVAVDAKRGTTWYLSRYDWERFEDMPKAFADAGQVVEHASSGAPLRARLQGYGLILDGLMVVTLLGSALLLLYGIVR